MEQININQMYYELVDLYNLAQGGDPEAMETYPQAFAQYNNLLASFRSSQKDSQEQESDASSESSHMDSDPAPGIQKESGEEKLKKYNVFDKLDEEIEKRAMQKAKQLRQARKKQYAGDPIELGQWTCDPDCNEDYPDISKDEYLGNLDDKEYFKMVQDDELIGFVMEEPEIFGGLMPLLVRRRKGPLAMSVSKRGMGRKLLSEENINLRKTTIEESKKVGRLREAFRKKAS